MALDDGQRVARLAHHDRRHPALEDTGLLSGNLLDRVAEEFGVVQGEARDHARERTLHDIGGVEPPAEPDFEQENIGPMPREQQKRRRRLDLKHGDRRVAVRAFAFDERAGKFIVGDQFAAVRAADPEALVEAHQIG